MTPSDAWKSLSDDSPAVIDDVELVTWSMLTVRDQQAVARGELTVEEAYTRMIADVGDDE